MTTIWSLIIFMHASGQTQEVYGGALMTPELCQMSGEGVKRAIEANVETVTITFTCLPQEMGESA
jgi:hypothetical protein